MKTILDICLTCGEEMESKLWGAKCKKGHTKSVHQLKCDDCSNLIGVIVDDDYCGPEKLICPACLDKYRK